MYVVQLWKNRYFKKKSGLKRGYKTVADIDKAKKFNTIYEVVSMGFTPGKHKIIEVKHENSFSND